MGFPRLNPDPGSVVAERLGELRFLGFHPPKQLLAFARELGAAASIPRAYVLEVWEERGFGSLPVA